MFINLPCVIPDSIGPACRQAGIQKKGMWIPACAGTSLDFRFPAFAQLRTGRRGNDGKADCMGF